MGAVQSELACRFALRDPREGPKVRKADLHPGLLHRPSEEHVGLGGAARRDVVGGVEEDRVDLGQIDELLEAARRVGGEAPADPEQHLLDEILRGTNTYERQVAVRRVLLHLLRRDTIGAISTHDLQLAEVEDLISSAVPVHFQETLHPGGDPPMTFDYRMRPGVATTVNALKLMELVGLRTEDL